METPIVLSFKKGAETFSFTYDLGQEAGLIDLLVSYGRIGHLGLTMSDVEPLCSQLRQISLEIDRRRRALSVSRVQVRRAPRKSRGSLALIGAMLGITLACVIGEL